MIKSKHQGVCKFSGSVGNDEQAQSLHDILSKEGVISLMCSPQDKQHPTGQCAAIVHDKERSLIANLGAALHFPTHHVDEIKSHVSDAKIFYATAFFLTSNPNALFKLLEHQKQRETAFALNLSATFLID